MSHCFVPSTFLWTVNVRNCKTVPQRQTLQKAFGSRVFRLRPGALARLRCLDTVPVTLNTISTPEDGDATPRDSIRETFPLVAVVGHDLVKLALLLAAVNPKVGGVLISGGRGTAKSVLARAVQALLPPIEVVLGSPYNEVPRGDLPESKRAIIPAPFVQVPLNATEDRLVGSIDIERSMKLGESVFQPGVLARAHRGILYVDDINLLDESIANLLLSVVSEGRVLVEREGISLGYPCEPLLIATFNPDEGPIRPHLADRMAAIVNADSPPLSIEERIRAVDAVTEFYRNPREFVRKYEQEMDELRQRIIFAREEYRDVVIARKQVEYLCEESIRGAVQGHRAEIFAAELARANAAFEGRLRVNEQDLRISVRLAIFPRAKVFYRDNNDEENVSQKRPPPPPPPPSNEQDGEEKEDESEQEQEEEDENEIEEAPQVPEEFMFDPEGVPIDPELLNIAQGQQKQGRSGGRGIIFSDERGRYVKAMFPRGKVKRVAIDATIRSAAPYQRMRRARQAQENGRRVFIEPPDLRAKRMARKAGALVLFVVDASGSMALNRMSSAKGAAIRLLAEAYQSRDQIALITFGGECASVLLPPTRSVSMAKRRLETMPCGGGSPLAHALTVAARVGVNAMKSGDIGRCVLVLVSDGRANIPLKVSLGEKLEQKPTKEELKNEVLDLAKKIRGINGFSILVIDSENKFVSTGLAKELAQAAGGTYHYIPRATDAAVAGVAADAIKQMRQL
jgi:magnesium chelatase subunit D